MDSTELLVRLLGYSVDEEEGQTMIEYGLTSADQHRSDHVDHGRWQYQDVFNSIAGKLHS